MWRYKTTATVFECRLNGRGAVAAAWPADVTVRSGRPAQRHAGAGLMAQEAAAVLAPPSIPPARQPVRDKRDVRRWGRFFFLLQQN